MGNLNNKSKLGRMMGVILVLGVLFFSSFSLYLVSAAPQGATILGAGLSVDNGPVKTASSRNDTGGKIITMRIDAQQQDTGWKAYVGNASGSFVLQNVNNKSIYQWPSSTTITGELYIARNTSVNWSTIYCANAGNISAEQTFFGMTGADPDSINNTFNSTLHKAFTVGTIPIPISTCPAIATWVNDTSQTPGPSAVFQEVLLSDNSNVVYASLLTNEQRGFDNSSNYDFQAIIAENKTSAVGTAYYFFLELGI